MKAYSRSQGRHFNRNSERTSESRAYIPVHLSIVCLSAGVADYSKLVAQRSAAVAARRRSCPEHLMPQTAAAVGATGADMQQQQQRAKGWSVLSGNKHNKMLRAFIQVSMLSCCCSASCSSVQLASILIIRLLLGQPISQPYECL